MAGRKVSRVLFRTLTEAYGGYFGHRVLNGVYYRFAQPVKTSSHFDENRNLRKGSVYEFVFKKFPR